MTARRGARSMRRVAQAGALLAAALGAALPAQAGVEEGRAKAALCVTCHGATGNSTMTGVPSLSAQPKQFLVSALFQFREGKRVNAVMSPLAANLTNADLNDLAAFFADQPAVATPAAAPEVIQEGKALAMQFNCVACHAANLMGQQHIPRLAGQRAEYLLDQLRAFKATTRADMDGTMTSAAQALTPEHIDVLARYLAGLPATR
ncbi:MAG: c-type cytochrome [Caldimonas sp.]